MRETEDREDASENVFQESVEFGVSIGLLEKGQRYRNIGKGPTGKWWLKVERFVCRSHQ